MLSERLPLSQPAPRTTKTPCVLIAMGLGLLSTSFQSPIGVELSELPPCKRHSNPLLIPARSVFLGIDAFNSKCKVCAFARAVFLRSREPTRLERTIFLDASSRWGGRGHKKLMTQSLVAKNIKTQRNNKLTRGRGAKHGFRSALIL